MEKAHNKHLLFALLINGVFASFVVLFFYTDYETNDDQLMLMLLTGSFSGTGSHYIMYVNSLLSFPLQLLYTSFPMFPWYPLLQYLTVFLSLTSITYVLMSKDTRLGISGSILLLCAFGFDFYTRMQFTKVAGCASAAGIVLGLHALAEVNNRMPNFIFSSILLLLGCCFRFKMSLVVVAMLSVLIPFYTYEFLKDKDYKKLRGYLIWLSLVILIFFSLAKINNEIYEKNKKWADYMEFNTYRSQLLDRSFPAYSENEEQYQTMGITQSDIILYRTWDFGDPDIFTPANVKTMADMRTSPSVDSAFFKSFITTVLAGYIDYSWFPALLISCAFAIYASRKNSIWALFQIFLVMAFSMYLFYYQRYLKNRVDICVFFASTLAMLIIYLDTRDKQSSTHIKDIILAICLISIVFMPSYVKYAKNNADADTLATQHREVVDYISNDSSNLYLVSLMSSNIWQDAYGIFEPMLPNTMSNICFMGGCFAFTPEWDKTLERWNIDNPYTDCINNEHIYIIDNKHIDSIVAYINRHYDPNAKAVLINTLNGCSFYQIVSQTP